MINVIISAVVKSISGRAIKYKIALTSTIPDTAINPPIPKNNIVARMLANIPLNIMRHLIEP